MNIQNTSLQNHCSPCSNCLVKVCCERACEDFIKYYITERQFVRLKLKEKGIDPTKRHGFNIFRKIMVKILSQAKSSHIEITQTIDDIITKKKGVKK
ncbi:MAG: hypothetical protein ACFFG0_04165 [Candidatus Thorarchaeota archaeon]